MSTTNGNGQSDVTPSSGIDLAALRALNPSEAVVYLAEQIREQREEGQRHRAVSAKAAAYAEMATKAADRARDSAESAVAAVSSLRAATHSDLADLDGRIIVAFGAQANALAAIRDEQKEFRALIGEAPRMIDPRESRSGEHTPEDLAKMESGTGLSGVVGRLSAQVSRLSSLRMAVVGGLGGALGAGLSSAAPGIVRAIFESLGG